MYIITILDTVCTAHLLMIRELVDHLGVCARRQAVECGGQEGAAGHGPRQEDPAHALAAGGPRQGRLVCLRVCVVSLFA